MDRERHRTMEELAKASGISRPTLSKYFEDPRSVRPSTRERIETALESHDYRPNLFARNLNRKRTRNIGIVVPHMTDPFYADLVSRLEHRCLAEKYWPIVISSHGSPEAEVRAIDLLHSVKVAGVILSPLGYSGIDDLIAAIRRDIPVVYCDVALDDQAPVVRNDNVQSVTTMVDYLCRTGAAPVYFEMPTVNTNSSERRAVYIETMERLGHEPMFIGSRSAITWDLENQAYETMLNAIDTGRIPSQTILCSNDRTAIGVIAAAFARKMSVGRGRAAGLRVAGHDDHPLSRFVCPPLTTMAQDVDGIARDSVAMLLGMMGDDGDRRRRVPPEDVILPGKLTMRQSA